MLEGYSQNVDIKKDNNSHNNHNNSPKLNLCLCVVLKIMVENCLFAVFVRVIIFKIYFNYTALIFTSSILHFEERVENGSLTSYT